MLILSLVLIIFVVTLVPMKGIVGVDKFEEDFIDNYKGFIDIKLIEANTNSDDLLDSGTGVNVDSNLQMLGDLNAHTVTDGKVDLDLNRYV